MCYGNPTESLDIARRRMGPEKWAKFEADFQHFCDYSGLKRPTPEMLGRYHLTFEWAKWAYLCGKGL